MGSVCNGFCGFPHSMIAGDTEVWKPLFNTNGTFLLGPSSSQDRIWKESSERMESLCVLKEFDFLKYRFSARREGALKAQSMGGWSGFGMCSRSGRVQHHDCYASHRLHQNQSAYGHLSIWRVSVSGESLFPEPVFGKSMRVPFSFGSLFGNAGEFANPGACFLQTVAAVRLLLVTRDSSQLASTSLEEKNSLTSPHREGKTNPLTWIPGTNSLDETHFFSYLF